MFWKRLTSAIAILSVFLAGVYLFPLPALANTDVFTASGTWTAPAGVTSVTADVWAGGGGGGQGSGGGAGAGGGGGGAFSEQTNVTVIPGNVYNLTVGQGGIGQPFAGPVGNGADSMFLSSSTVLAKGGSGGSSGSGSSGGLASGGIGTTKHSGGNGGSDGSVNGSGGGGGGGAGTTADGGVGADASGTSGGAGGTGGSVGGGKGGDGSTGSGLNNAATKGGGATGPGGGNTGFNGARGEVDITYTAAATTHVNTPIKIANGSIKINNTKLYVQ